MRTIKYIITAIVLIVSTTGCIKEKLSDCTPGVYLTYYFTHNKQNTNQFENKVDRLEIYVFDANNNLYNKYIFTETKKLTNDHKINLPLPQGEWKIFTWGGDMTDYTVNDRTLLLKTDDKISDTEELTNHPLTPLYHGEVTSITTYEDKYTYAKIPLRKNISTINININGTSKHPIGWQPSDFDIETTLNNSAQTFDNAIADQSKLIHYRSISTIEGNTLKTAHNVMRLMLNDTSGKITIKSGYLPEGKVELPLLETILQNPKYKTQDDLDREDTYEFNIDLNIEDTTIKITITINDWAIIYVIPGVE